LGLGTQSDLIALNLIPKPDPTAFNTENKKENVPTIFFDKKTTKTMFP
jgi:hypothetical protein